MSEDREGLLDTIQRNRLNYQKRAYQCIKCLVQLFRKSPLALNMLQANNQISRPWSSAVEWLHDELDRQRGVASQYNYSSWSPPAQSNENTNSFILERSQSAKNVLQMAFELCPEEVCYHIISCWWSFTRNLIQQEPEEPNDSEVEPIDDFQRPTTKVTKENITDDGTLEAFYQAHQLSLADEEAVNKVVEKIDTLRLGPRQVNWWFKIYVQLLIVVFNRSLRPRRPTVLQLSSLMTCPTPTLKSFRERLSIFNRRHQSNRESPNKNHRPLVRFKLTSFLAFGHRIWLSHQTSLMRKCSYADFYDEKENNQI